MAESNTYVGVVSGTNIMSRSTYQLLTSTDKFSKSVQWACFNKTPFMQAVGLEAFGVDAVKDLQAFGAAQSSGRIVVYDSGVYAYKGSVFATTGTSFHTGRMGTFNPELVEGGDEWAYAWHKLNNVQYIPVVDVQDNGKGMIDIKAQKMEGMKQKFVQDVNYCFLGSSSAPDTGVLGPDSLYSDLPNLISYTQTRTVGGIAKSAGTYWQNGYKAIASIGGGGDMDRPIMLRRSLKDAKNDQAAYAEATNDYLLLASQGAFQYYDRLMYADSVQSGRGGAFGTIQKYDAAGIEHFAFGGSPMVWDPAVTVPYGATASTESIYGIHIPSYFISIRTEENFKASDWEPPREHDAQKTYVASLQLRYTPGMRAMRPNFVAYNMPACPD
uniref:Capsid protein n=1 Tax=viral metagenome TaxID=1070528 RepID=A0A6M3IS73_9ZZZZ